MNHNIELLFRVRTTLHDGTPVKDSPQHIASEAYFANNGDTIRLTSSDYIFAVGTYSLERDKRFKEEYCYLADSMWLTYNEDLKPDGYGSDPYTFEKDCYYKLCFKRADGQDVETSDLENIIDHLVFDNGLKLAPKNHESGIRDVFKEEAVDTIQKCNEKDKDVFKLILLTDTHNVVNGTWKDTERNIQHVARAISPNAIVHLGDLSDGIVSRKRTERLANEVISGLTIDDIPFYMAIGNHDSNYFYRNDEYMEISEQAEFYLKRDKPYYFVDLDGIRMIFLYSYDNDRKIRYGYSKEQIEWIKKVFDETPNGMNMLIFSHDAPLAKLDYWSEEIFNGLELVNVIDAENKQTNRILSFIHGHTHADNICRDYSFPIISIANNKCEDFLEYKPEGFVTQKRAFDHVTQDLWDVLLYRRSTNTLELIRFGAGDDRSVF